MAFHTWHQEEEETDKTWHQEEEETDKTKQA